MTFMFRSPIFLLGTTAGAIGALESRVVVSARRFRQLGTGGTAEIAEPNRVNVVSRIPG